MYDLKTSEDSPSATSLQELADGPAPCASQASAMTPLSGVDRLHANPSPTQEAKAGSTTLATFGPTSTDLSRRAAQIALWESRLQALMPSGGGTLYVTTWKDRTTPAGRRISALRASAQRTSASGCTGWPTPISSNVKGANEAENVLTHNARPLQEMAKLAGWPTDPQISVADVAVHLAGWPTPTVTDEKRGASDPRPWDTGKALNQIASLACRGPARLTASGDLLTGSTAEMTSGGQLNPALSRWLQNYPEAWCRAAVLAWRSMPTTPRKPARSASKGMATPSTPK
jgi:hypothetical protein